PPSMSCTAPRLDLLCAVALSLLTVLSRLPFRARMLYNWDAVQFALALREYDVSKHQPHPPGYILYVGLGRIVNAWLGDPAAAYALLAVVFSGLTTFVVFYLARAAARVPAVARSHRGRSPPCPHDRDRAGGDRGCDADVVRADDLAQRRPRSVSRRVARARRQRGEADLHSGRAVRDDASDLALRAGIGPRRPGAAGAGRVPRALVRAPLRLGPRRVVSRRMDGRRARRLRGRLL